MPEFLLTQGPWAVFGLVCLYAYWKERQARSSETARLFRLLMMLVSRHDTDWDVDTEVRDRVIKDVEKLIDSKPPGKL